SAPALRRARAGSAPSPAPRRAPDRASRSAPGAGCSLRARARTRSSRWFGLCCASRLPPRLGSQPALAHGIVRRLELGLGLGGDRIRSGRVGLEPIAVVELLRQVDVTVLVTDRDVDVPLIAGRVAGLLPLELAFERPERRPEL